MRIHKNVFELIGNTPLVELTNYENNHGLDAGIIAKVEYSSRPARLRTASRRPD